MTRDTVQSLIYDERMHNTLMEAYVKNKIGLLEPSSLY